MKQFNTQVMLKPPVTGSTSFTFETKEAWLQGHTKQDINSVDANNTHMLIPRHAIGLMVFWQSEDASLPPSDAFCGNIEADPGDF